jgi:hypothetical protein
MALFVLRTGYRVETTATGGRVVHLRTGDALELSAVEVQLLARAMAGGVDPSEPGLRPVVRKMASLGVLVPSGRAPGASGRVLDPPVDLEAPDLERNRPEPQRLEANAAVPLLRSDLLLAPAAGGQVTVRDPRTGRSAALHEFEVSLARMFDGRRRISEVMLGAQRLGIPASLESLSQFVRQLERLGFLVSGPAAPPAPAEGTTWEPRAKWDDGARVLFQTGLRLARRGRYPEAARYFEALVSKDPDNAQARQWLDEVTRRNTPPSEPTATRAPQGSWLVSPETFQGAQSPDGFAAATFAAPEAPAATELEEGTRARSDRDTTRRFAPIQLHPEPPTDPELLAVLPEEGASAAPAVDDLDPSPADARLSPHPEDSLAEDGLAPLAPESDTAADELPSPDSTISSWTEPEPAQATSAEAPRFPEFEIPPLAPAEPALDAEDPIRLEPLPELAPPPLSAKVPDAAHDAPLELAGDRSLEPPLAHEPERTASSGLLDLDLLTDAPARPAGPEFADAPAAPALEIESLFYEKEAPPPAEVPAHDLSDLSLSAAETLLEVPPDLASGALVAPPRSDPSMPETSGAGSESQPGSPADAPAQPPPRSPARSRRALAIGLGIAAALGIGAWVLSRPTPAVKLAESAPARSPGQEPARPTGQSEPGPSNEASAHAAKAAGAASKPAERAASSAHPTPAAQPSAGEAGPSRGTSNRPLAAGGASPSPIGAKPEAHPPIAVALLGPSAAERDRRWTVARLVRRGRVTMGELKALVGGTVSWQAQPRQRVKAGESVGLLRASKVVSPEALEARRRLATLEEAAKKDPSQEPLLEAERRKVASLEKERALDVALKAPKAGLLMPAIADQAKCKAGDKLAAVVYHEAYLIALTAGTKPEQSWECRIADSSLKQSEPCHVVSAAPAAGGWAVTATTAALWIDAAPSASMELSPPAQDRP